jgi:hypothetical protein
MWFGNGWPPVVFLAAVLEFRIRNRIRIRMFLGLPVSDPGAFRIRMFLGLLDPHPDPQFICMDPAPDPDPSINLQKKMKKNLDFFCFVTSL